MKLDSLIESNVAIRKDVHASLQSAADHFVQQIMDEYGQRLDGHDIARVIRLAFRQGASVAMKFGGPQ